MVATLNKTITKNKQERSKNMRVYVMDYFGEIVTRELFPIPVNGWKLAKWATNSNFITENSNINFYVFKIEYG